jgi:hypothetical protein
MSAFPVLKTGAVAQYPLERSVRFPVQAVRFLDGSQQIYQLSAGGLRRWVIRLELLDEAEAVALVNFAEAQQGSEFAFTDPVTGDVVNRCVIGRDKLRAGLASGHEAWTEVYIEEVV